MTTARNDTRVTLGSRHAHLWWIRPDTLTDPAEILSHELGQVEGAKEKYAALTEEQRTQFNRLYNSQIGEGTEVDTAPKQGGMFPNMGAMAEMTDQERAAMAERQPA